jgi:hypothetical protein
MPEILGSEERQPLMDEDIPLTVGLPAAELKWARAGCHGLRPPMTALEPWELQVGQIREARFPPDSAVRPCYSEGRLLYRGRCQASAFMQSPFLRSG